MGGGVGVVAAVFFSFFGEGVVAVVVEVVMAVKEVWGTRSDNREGSRKLVSY